MLYTLTTLHVVMCNILLQLHNHIYMEILTASIQLCGNTCMYTHTCARGCEFVICIGSSLQLMLNNRNSSTSSNKNEHIKAHREYKKTTKHTINSSKSLNNTYNKHSLSLQCTQTLIPLFLHLLHLLAYFLWTRVQAIKQSNNTQSNNMNFAIAILVCEMIVVGC